MKILIISLPRTGSTSLSYDLSIKYNLRECFEPFEKGAISVYKKSDKNIVLKSLIFQKPVSFYLNLSKEFDEIILLSRKDLYECAKSWAFLDYNKNLNSLEKYVWYETPNLQKTYENIKIWNENLNKISTELGINIKYYEDLFDIDSIDRLRIKEVYIKEQNTLI